MMLSSKERITLSRPSQLEDLETRLSQCYDVLMTGDLNPSYRIGYARGAVQEALVEVRRLRSAER